MKAKASFCNLNTVRKRVAKCSAWGLLIPNCIAAAEDCFAAVQGREAARWFMPSRDSLTQQCPKTVQEGDI